jgi:phage protein D
MGDKMTPQINIKIAGSTSIQGDAGAIETRGGTQILSVTVDMRLDTPDMFVVEYDMMDQEKIAALDTFQEGQEVEVQLGFESPVTVMKGEIAYIEPHFDSVSGNRCSIVGYDKSHRLTRGMKPGTWGDGLKPQVGSSGVTSDVVSKSGAHIGGASDGLATDKVKPKNDPKMSYIPKLNTNDYQFLKALGQDTASATNADAGKLSFRAPDPSGSAKITLTRDRLEEGGAKSIPAQTVKFKLSSAKQYSQVEVRGWDPNTKKNIVGVAKSSTFNFDASEKGWTSTNKGFYNSGSSGRTYVVVDQPVETKEQAEKLAQSIFDQLSMDYLTGEATFDGQPELKAGDVIELKGYGKRYSGKYVLTSVTHTFRPDEGYKCSVAFARNAANPGK